MLVYCLWDNGIKIKHLVDSSSKNFWGSQLSQSLIFSYYRFLLLECKLGKHPDLACLVHYCVLSPSDRIWTLDKYLLNERMSEWSLGLGMAEPIRVAANVNCNMGDPALVLWGGLLSTSSSLWLIDNLQWGTERRQLGQYPQPIPGEVLLGTFFKSFLIENTAF